MSNLLADATVLDGVIRAESTEVCTRKNNADVWWTRREAEQIKLVAYIQTGGFMELLTYEVACRIVLKIIGRCATENAIQPGFSKATRRSPSIAPSVEQSCTDARLEFFVMLQASSAMCANAIVSLSSTRFQRESLADTNSFMLILARAFLTCFF